jgi:GT2 family glycosyltransferase
MRPDVGAVGTRLLYADGTIQHAGAVLRGATGGTAHEGVGEKVSHGGYLGRSRLQRGIATVTGACMATRKQVFDLVDGFDEVFFKVAYNDTDFCMKVRAAGLSVIYTPFATMYHYESKSRGIAHLSEYRERDALDGANFKLRWALYMDDPFYNRHFERNARPFESLRPPDSLLP